MLAHLATRLGVPPTTVAAILALLTVQLALQAWALVDLARRRAVRGDSKWLWAAVIVFGSAFGVLLYAAIARVPAPPVEDGHARAGDAMSARRAVDILYGPRDRP